jgi:hypothetical protein
MRKVRDTAARRYVPDMRGLVFRRALLYSCDEVAGPGCDQAGIVAERNRLDRVDMDEAGDLPRIVHARHAHAAITAAGGEQRAFPIECDSIDATLVRGARDGLAVGNANSDGFVFRGECDSAQVRTDDSARCLDARVDVPDPTLLVQIPHGDPSVAARAHCSLAIGADRDCDHFDMRQYRGPRRQQREPFAQRAIDIRR